MASLWNGRVLRVLVIALVLAVVCTGWCEGKKHHHHKRRYHKGTGDVDDSPERKRYVERIINWWNSDVENATVRSEKWEKMSTNPFAFFRATFFLGYSDVLSGVGFMPRVWLTISNQSTWVIADLHAQNIGWFDDGEGEIVFNLNDLDDSFIAPFHWDLIRFVASIYLFRPEFDFEISDFSLSEEVRFFLETYRWYLRKVIDNPTWPAEYFGASNQTTGWVSKITEEVADTDPGHALRKWTKVIGGNRVFKAPEECKDRLVPITDEGEDEDVVDNFDTFAASMGDRYDPRYFAVKATSRRRLAGLGSFGLNKRYYMLIEGPTESIDDDIILEVKQEHRVALLYFGYESKLWPNNELPSNAEVYYHAARMMYPRFDINHTGFVLGSEGRSYYVRRLSNFKRGVDGSDFTSRSVLHNFLNYTAIAIANAHTHPNQFPANISHIPYNVAENAFRFLSRPATLNLIDRAAKDYADQTNQDWIFFKELIEEGNLDLQVPDTTSSLFCREQMIRLHERTRCIFAPRRKNFAVFSPHQNLKIKTKGIEASVSRIHRSIIVWSTHLEFYVTASSEAGNVRVYMEDLNGKTLAYVPILIVDFEGPAPAADGTVPISCDLPTGGWFDVARCMYARASFSVWNSVFDLFFRVFGYGI